LEKAASALSPKNSAPQQGENIGNTQIIGKPHEKIINTHFTILFSSYKNAW
jgi:hypothetical protein